MSRLCVRARVRLVSSMCVWSHWNWCVCVSMYIDEMLFRIQFWNKISSIMYHHHQPFNSSYFIFTVLGLRCWKWFIYSILKNFSFVNRFAINNTCTHTHTQREHSVMLLNWHNHINLTSPNRSNDYVRSSDIFGCLLVYFVFNGSMR